MSKGMLVLLALLLLLFPTACAVPEPTKTGIPEPSRAPQPGNTLEASIAPGETASPTPVGDIGWRKVIGVVYFKAQGTGNELVGATIRCSHHSYTSPPEASCAPHQLTTGPDGAFEFELFVHDTDGIRISAEKMGYQPAEVKLGGFDCVGACPQVILVLEKIE